MSYKTWWDNASIEAKRRYWTVSDDCLKDIRARGWHIFVYNTAELGDMWVVHINWYDETTKFSAGGANQVQCLAIIQAHRQAVHAWIQQEEEKGNNPSHDLFIEKVPGSPSSPPRFLAEEGLGNISSGNVYGF